MGFNYLLNCCLIVGTYNAVTAEYHDTRTENRPTKELERDFQSVPADNGDDETFGNHWNGMSQEDDVHSEGKSYFCVPFTSIAR